MKNLLNNEIGDLIDNVIKKVFSQLNCIKVGKIIKFYPEDKTADIQILNKIKDEQGNIKDISILSKCLVVGNKITLPVEVGEQVVVLFNDYDINAYFETGDSQEPYSTRKHDLSDGIVICGLNSMINAIQYDNTAICLNYEQSRINGNLEVNGEQINNSNITINGNSNNNGDIIATGNIEGATFSTDNQAGVSGTFTDTGAGSSGKTLTITNGLITNIS